MREEFQKIQHSDGRQRVFSADGKLLSIDGVPVVEEENQEEAIEEIKEEDQ